MAAHDESHDRGLLHDLAILQARFPGPPRLERRHALKVVGGAGLGLLLAACGGSGSAPSAATSSTTSTTVGGSTTTTAGTTATTTATSPTEAVPEETAGPYPGDGSNGPDVLTQSGIVRRDIRSSFGSAGGTAVGVPLEIALTVVDARSGDPLPGAAVYAWHCDRAGGYSLYSPGITDQNYLRGVQVAADDGTLGFTSVFPAAYSGRWPHVHFEVFADLASATTAGGRLVTSQLALPEDVCDAAYATEGYEQSARNMTRTPLESDMVFRDGWDLQMATVTGDVDRGLTAALAFAV
ncbi:MAG: intradiol ring-cleavage dioxygenase [Acidimicrobiia bacterium]